MAAYPLEEGLRLEELVSARAKRASLGRLSLEQAARGCPPVLLDVIQDVAGSKPGATNTTCASRVRAHRQLRRQSRVAARVVHSIATEGVGFTGTEEDLHVHFPSS